MVQDDSYIHPPHQPRAREHIGLIHWSLTEQGEWTTQIVRGQFVSGDVHTWRIRLYDDIELEYDMDAWAHFQP
ncbi:hypothetical protein AB4Z18_01590 [Leifsonia sp. 2TAF2]|uniref:hypothetical protein n=1 Tax=Leifsonia sp. 2TAF2 TaxID=3233009 RepID=UPI003F997F23